MAERNVLLFGRVYRWARYDGGKEVRVGGNLRLLPSTPPPEGEKVKVAVAEPWTPSPCARWNAEQIVRKLAQEGVGEVVPGTEGPRA